MIAVQCLYCQSLYAHRFALFMASLHLPANHLIIEGIIRPVDPKPPQKCVMPLSKACRKGEEKRRKRGRLIQYSVCTTTHNKTLQCSTYIQRHMHIKLKDRGWWCHKWQALTGRISIPHNSGSPCMSDKFMIPPKCCSPIFLCIKMGVFDVARFHHAVWLVSLIQRMWLTQH